MRQMVSIHPPSGFRDFIQHEALRRFKLMRLISEVYQSFGFWPLETPAVEHLDILMGQGGGGDENEKLIFKILKRGAKLEEALQNENKIAEVGLRFDMTLPLSRVVALHRNQIRLPWKVFHLGPVWRAERPQRGRFREFIQCDVDIVGATGVGAELEVIQAVVHAIHKVGARGFELRLNDRRLIQALGEKFGFIGARLDSFAVLLDKKDKMEWDEWMDQVSQLSGSQLPQNLVTILKNGLSLDAAREFHDPAARDLKTLISLLEALNLPLERIVFDATLVRGMAYYTGSVFELRHSSAGYSFGGGGRYDQLIGRWSAQEIPACGFSLGFERLTLLLAENESQQSNSQKLIFIPVFDEKLRGKILSLASSLRTHGKVVVDVFPEQAKVKKQFKFASEMGYRWVLIAGEEEWVNHVFKLKDFSTGEEKEIPESEINEYLRGVWA